MECNATGRVLAVCHGESKDRKLTHCMSTMLPEKPEGAKLSWLLQPELRFLIPKNLVLRFGDDAPRLCTSVMDAVE